MKKIQKSIALKICNGVLALDERHLESTQGFFCPVCDFVMSTSNDKASYEKYQCCDYCRVKFAEPQREKWQGGWRPSKDQVATTLEKFSNLPDSFQIK